MAARNVAGVLLMPAFLATIIFALGIIALFILDRDRDAPTSWALWLPILWLLIAGSRPVSVWLGSGTVNSIDETIEGNPLNRDIYLFLIAVGFVVLLTRTTAVLSFIRANWLILLFVLYCAISIVWSDYPGVAFKRWFKSLGDFVFVLIVLTDKDQANALKRVLARVGFILLPISILLIKYYPSLGRAYSSHEGTQFFVGASEDKNMLGMTCMVFGLAAAWRVFQALSGHHQFKTIFVHGTVLAMSVWLLILANSMTSLFCLALACGLIAATSFFRRARKRVVVHFMVAAIVVLCFSLLFLHFGGDLLSSIGRNSTLTGRTEIWDSLLAVPTNPIIGTGFESFWLGERVQRLWAIPIMAGINEAHNGYIEVYLNLGWIGLAFLSALIVSGYRNIIRLLDRDPEAGRLRLGYFVIALTYNFTEAAIRTSDLVWIAFLIAIFIVPDAVHERFPIRTTKGVRAAAGNLSRGEKSVPGHALTPTRAEGLC